MKRGRYTVVLLVGLAITAVLIADFKLFGLQPKEALMVKFGGYAVLLPLMLYMLFKKPAGTARNIGVAVIIIMAILLFTMLVRDWRMLVH